MCHLCVPYWQSQLSSTLSLTHLLSMALAAVVSTLRQKTAAVTSHLRHSITIRTYTHQLVGND